MRIICRNQKESHWNGQRESSIPQKYDQPKCDCSSEDFIKPKLSLMINRINVLKMGSNNTLKQKQNIALDTWKEIVIDLATQLDRITTKAPGLFLADFLVDDLCLEECKCFILRWSKELKCLNPKNRSIIYKVSYAERLRRCKGLTISKHVHVHPTEEEKDVLWWIKILQSLPKSSVCQEECARVKLLDLYTQWKKGQLINILPVMDFIMRTILMEKDSILKPKLQQRCESRWDCFGFDYVLKLP